MFLQSNRPKREAFFSSLLKEFLLRRMSSVLLKIQLLLTAYFLVFRYESYLWKWHGGHFCASLGFLPVCGEVHLKFHLHLRAFMPLSPSTSSYHFLSIWYVSYKFYFKNWIVLLYNNWGFLSKNIKKPGFLLPNIIITLNPFICLSPATQLNRLRSLNHKGTFSFSFLTLLFLSVCKFQLHTGPMAAETGASEAWEANRPNKGAWIPTLKVFVDQF